MGGDANGARAEGPVLVCLRVPEPQDRPSMQREALKRGVPQPFKPVLNR